MAKRSTIGENPLDAVIQANPLDTVVPDLSVVSRGSRGQPTPELAPEAQERFKELEAGLNGLQGELAVAKAAGREVASLRGELTGLQTELARVRSEVERFKGEVATLAAEVGRLKTEVTQVREELAMVRAAQGPGDLPWWMRGKKK